MRNEYILVQIRFCGIRETRCSRILHFLGKVVIIEAAMLKSMLSSECWPRAAYNASAKYFKIRDTKYHVT
jgi:hypothetical protein